MPRPRRMRRVGLEPGVTYFKPAGIPKNELEQVVLSIDEYEAVRLKDFLGIDQIEAAEKMNISQPTFHRLLLDARTKIADSIINGKALKIEGGNFKLVKARVSRGFGLRKGSGNGRCYGFGRNSTNCVCPKCGEQKQKTQANPCTQEKCPKCGALMIRSNSGGY